MLRATILSLVLVGACTDSPDTSSGQCSRNDDCTGGQVCIDGDCLSLCTRDSDCDAGEICSSDVCALGVREDRPIIDSIDGDGSIDGDNSHTTHRYERELTIHGQHLEGASVVLSNGSSDWPVEICDSSASQMVVTLPSNIPHDPSAPMTLALRVSNQAGFCDTTLPVLEGEQGPQGIAGVAGAPGVPCSGCVDSDTIATGAVGVEHLAADVVGAMSPAGTIIMYGGNACPTGYLECDGATVDRAVEADLFAAIGVSFGAGDLIDTFNLPDLRGAFVRGWDHGRGMDPDAATRAASGPSAPTGDNVGTWQTDAFNTHTHTAHAPPNDVNSSSSQGYPANDNHTSFRTSDRAGVRDVAAAAVSIAGGSETRPANLSLLFCIKR